MSARYSYRAVDAAGKPMNGNMDAESLEEVGAWLADRGYFVVEVKLAALQSLVVTGKKKTKISADDMNFFFIQLSSLISAGCPLLMSIDALQKQAPSMALKTLLVDIGEKIQSGKSFSEALKNHNNVFSNLFITMVEVGEVGGILDQVLERYAYIHDSTHRLRNKMFKAMIYPIVLLITTLVVAWAVLVFVFPKLIGEIQASGQKLPLPTEIVLMTSNFVSTYFVHMFLAVFFAYFIYATVKKTESGGLFIDKFWLSLVMIGNLIKQLQVVLFSRTLGVLLSSGVPILTSIQAVERTMGNRCYKEAISDTKEAVSRGESLSQAISRHRHLFSDTIVLMISVGEQTGNIGDMLEKMGKIYERELESTLESAVSLLEPCLVVFLSGFVALLALAVYLPIFDMGKLVR
ncbi:MAG: type II secretion system F family protein [Candidatus Riflebacteria bacterium]|nr:type II secretion system F family protein [Candidatus Riflebacteria bacterium]